MAGRADGQKTGNSEFPFGWAGMGGWAENRKLGILFRLGWDGRMGGKLETLSFLSAGLLRLNTENTKSTDRLGWLRLNCFG